MTDASSVWTFNPDNYNENDFGIIPAGRHRVRIDNAELKTSKTSHHPMIEVTFSVSGYASKLWYYIVLDSSDAEHTKFTDQKLGQFFDCFEIVPGNLHLSDWRGCVGGVQVRHTKDNRGNDRAEVHYVLKHHQVLNLPAWQEVSRSAVGQSSTQYQADMPENLDAFQDVQPAQNTLGEGSSYGLF